MRALCRLHRNVVGVAVLNGFLGVAVTGFYALFSVYLSSLGFSVDKIGLVFAVAELVGCSLAPISGALARAHGARLATALASAMAVAGLLLASTSTSLVQALASLALVDASFYLGQPARTALIAYSVGWERLGRGVGVATTAFSVARIVGPTAAGVLAQAMGFGKTFAVLAAVAVLGIASFLVLSVEPGAATNGESSTLVSAYKLVVKPKGKLSWIYLPASLDRIAWMLWFPALGAHLKLCGYSEAEIGAIFSLQSLVQAVLLPPAGRLVDSVGPGLAFATSEVLGAAAALMLVHPHPLHVLVAAATSIGISTALWVPSYAALVARSYRGRLEEAYAAVNCVRGFAGVPAPLIGGVVYELASPLILFMTSALVMLAAAAAVLKAGGGPQLRPG